MMASRRQRPAIHAWRPIVWIGIAAVLLVPLIAMQFTEEVRWTGFDFAVGAGLLVGAVAIYEIAARFVTEPRLRILIGGALTLIALLLWAEGADGIF